MSGVEPKRGSRDQGGSDVMGVEFDAEVSLRIISAACRRAADRLVFQGGDKAVGSWPRGVVILTEQSAGFIWN